MIARFRVATRACGRRRNVYVHVYDDRMEMALAHARARGLTDDDTSETAGGMSWGVGGHGWTWRGDPATSPDPVMVIRLWTGQLTTSTIAHEATHAAALIYFMDALAAWDTRARTVLMGDHEPLAYAVGDLTREITYYLFALALLPRPTEETP